MSRFKGFRPVVLAAIAVLALIALGACGGKIPPTHFYALDLSVPATPRPANTLDHSVLVMPMRAADRLTQDRIIYRPSREEVGYYEYHRWADEPRSSVTAALVEKLREKGTFNRVAMFDGRTKADYILRGRVSRLEEVDFEEGVKVYAAIELELIDGKDASVAWSGTGEASSPVETAEMRDVVGRMSEAMKRSIDQAAGDLDSFLR